MKWRLTSQGEIHYFQFTWHRDSAIYSLKKGQDAIIQNLDPVFLKQIHSNVIVDIDSKQERTGDGLISAGRHNIGVKIADCLPVYLFTPEKICIIHCGWRGVIEGIAKQAREMLKEFQYVLGASIGPCCYEVQHDVADRFIQSHPNALQQRESRYYLDLKTAVIDDLGRRALLGSLNYCTRCHPEYFYSHRRGDSGRNYAIATRRLTD
ncbi:MAG: polyphenol oxidase family protein [candidate division WOR-3 bacterium]|nr:MAG: polyphenol oxidase family protein [candidate division WOR-3 bacterium]